MQLRSRIWKRVQPYVYIAPAVVFLTLFTLYPILRSVVLSFTESDALFQSIRFVGFDQYAKMARSPVFWQVLWNTLLYGASQVILTAVLGLFLALLANSRRMRCKSLFKAAVFYPYILPWTVAAMVWMYLLHPTRGVVNAVLGARIEWLNQFGLTFWVLVMLCVWKTTGFNFLLFLAGLQNISPELYEAARLETRNPWHVFRHITLPLITPTAFTVMLLSVVGSFQSVDLIQILTQGRPGNSTNTLVYYIYQQGIASWNVGYGSALSTVLFVLLLVLTLVYFALAEKKVQYEQW